MAINFNTGPYYDDYDVEKNFYRVLYKPGYAVQARELNQMQSIQQHQTASMANHIFRKNSMVAPGGIALNTRADIVFFGSSETVSDLSTLVGKTITNAPAFDYTNDASLDGYITAVVLGYRNADANSDVPGCLYVRYIKTNTSDNRATFNTSEILQTVEENVVSFVTDSTYASGFGKVATLAAGIFYTTDLFVDAADQSIIVETNSDTSTTCSIGLQIVESIVTSNDDESLLDNANGAPNQYAPGADRHKVELILTRVDGFQNTDLDKFIVMMTIENNVVTFINDKTQYSEIMKMIARRTYDANGNFVVEGLQPSVNNSTNTEYVVASLTKGRCYVGGYEYSQLADDSILIRKPRDVDHTAEINNATKYVDSLTDFMVAGGDLLEEMPAENALVQFLNASPRKVTFAASDVDTGSGNDITITGHLFVTGNAVLYDNGGDDSIGSLTDGETYYVVKTSDDTIKLSDTYEHAIAGTNLIDFTGGGTGTAHSLEKVADIIGTGIFKNIQFFNGSPGTNDIYKAYFDWVIFEQGYTVEDVGGYRVVSPTPINQGGSILHEIRVGSQTGLFENGDDITSTTLANVRAKLFDVVNLNVLYVVKDSTVDVPRTEVISNGTYTATTKSFFVSNYIAGNYPMIQVDSSTIKHISNVQYSVIRRRVFQPTVENDRTQSWQVENVGETYENLSVSDFYAYNVTKQYFIELNTSIASIINGGDTFKIDLADNSAYDGDTIWIYTTIKKSAATPITRSVTQTTMEIKDHSRTYMALGHSGVKSILKVVDGGIKAVVFDGDNDKVQLEAHGLSNGDTVYFKSLTNISGISVDTKYYVKNKTVDDFELAETLGGSTVDITVDASPGTGVMMPPPNINSGVDITIRYNLYTEDTANVCGTSLIKIRKSTASPLGRIAVKYEYWQFSASGDYVSVDSYGAWDNTDGIEGDADLQYIATIPDTTTSRKGIVQTRKFLDYRTRTSNYFFKNRGFVYNGETDIVIKDLNLMHYADALVGTYIVGPGFQDSAEISAVSLDDAGNTIISVNSIDGAIGDSAGVYFIGLIEDSGSLIVADPLADAQSFVFPKSDALLTYSYIKFTPKNILVYANRSKDQITIENKEVQTFNEAYQLRRDENNLPLSYIEMQPYTIDMSEINVYNFQNPVYKMLDIHDLKLRLDRTEYYTSLSLDKDIDRAVFDAQNENADQSKFGLWNENFADMVSQEYDSPDFECSIYDRTYVSPIVVTRTINLELDEGINPTTWQKTGSALTLPYVESAALENPFASEYVNVNPFAVLFYKGKMQLNPPVDNWIDLTVAPTVAVSTTTTVNSGTTTITPVVRPVIPPSGATGIVGATGAIGATGPVGASGPVVGASSAVVDTNTTPRVIEEIVTEVTNLRTSWGPDSEGGSHAITFNWRTNLGRTGRVNTDKHLSSIINTNGFDGSYASSLINRRYNDPGVAGYLNAGTHFDQKPPKDWKPANLSIAFGQTWTVLNQGTNIFGI